MWTDNYYAANCKVCCESLPQNYLRMVIHQMSLYQLSHHLTGLLIVPTKDDQKTPVSSTDSTSNESSSSQHPSNMPETHLLQAETGLKISNTDLIAFCETLEDLEAQVAEAKTLHRKYSQQAAGALTKQETADQNIEKIRGLEELPNADGEDPSSTEILARYCRSAERAKAGKTEYEDRAQAALVKLRAYDKSLEDANKQVMSRAKVMCKAEKYVKYLRRFSGSSADG